MEASVCKKVAKRVWGCMCEKVLATSARRPFLIRKDSVPSLTFLQH